MTLTVNYTPIMQWKVYLLETKADGPLHPYQIIYPDDVAKKLFNGERVINKLSDKVQYTVSADWVAAARQGGTASATYQLQKTLSGTSSWEEVQTITLNFDELHMSRSGDDGCKFQEVDMYDTWKPL